MLRKSIYYVIFSQKNYLSNDYLYFVAQEIAKPLNDVHMFFYYSTLCNKI